MEPIKNKKEALLIVSSLLLCLSCSPKYRIVNVQTVEKQVFKANSKSYICGVFLDEFGEPLYKNPFSINKTVFHSDTLGRFCQWVDPGTFTIEAVGPIHKRAEIKNLKVSQGDSVVLKIKMQLLDD